MNRIFLLVCLFFSHCVTFYKNDASVDLKNSSAPTAKIWLLTVSQSQKLGNGEAAASRENDRKISEDRIKKILMESRYASSVSTDPNSPYDIKLSLSIESDVSLYSSPLGMIATWISFLTATVIPFDADQNTKFKYDFEPVSKKMSHQSVKSVYYNTWIGFLTLPLMPFYSSEKAAEESMREITMSSLNEALQRDF